MDVNNAIIVGKNNKITKKLSNLYLNKKILI